MESSLNKQTDFIQNQLDFHTNVTVFETHEMTYQEDFSFVCDSVIGTGILQDTFRYYYITLTYAPGPNDPTSKLNVAEITLQYVITTQQ